MSASSKHKTIKNTEKPIQKFRFIVQSLFAVLCIWIGIEFYFFITYLESNGSGALHHRPPGVEGFLPISALMSVFYFIKSGEIHQVHPAGFFILLAIIGVSFVFGKAFCGWLCPVGFISELVGDFGERIWKKFFKKRFKLPKLFDYPLRAIKYLLLAFFAYAIFSMTTITLYYFLGGPYNIMADVKMWYFFANISQLSLIVIASLFVLSIFIRNFWCRYLCPYGALLGIIGFLSPFKIKRNPTSCIDCNLCAKACPSFIKVDKVLTVRSDECNTCLSCVDACPVADTLELKNSISNKKIKKSFVAIGIIIIFVSIAGLGMITGNWQNNIKTETYIQLSKHLDSIGHPTSTGEINALNKQSEIKSKETKKLLR